MLQRLKGMARGCLFVVLLMVGVPSIVIMFMLGDSPNACWEDSEAVAHARALPANRLSALYRDMKVLANAGNTPLEGYSRFETNDRAIPPQFADLNATRVRPKDANIMLQGCMDAGVDLAFEGLTDPAQPARIVLHWGDHHESGEQVLWQE
jgi:hypothetical protein